MPEIGFGARWVAGMMEVGAAMEAWRRTHQRATFAQIESVLDQHVNALRAQMLTDVAVASPTGGERGDRPTPD